MDKIVIGKKENVKYAFRETCFGIYEKQNKILLVKKDGQYSLVGGEIELGESKEKCLTREFKEETGYEMIKINEFAIIDCFWLAGGKWPLESLANIFIVDVNIDCSKQPAEAEHIAEFIDINDAMELLKLPYQKKALELYLNSKK